MQETGFYIIFFVFSNTARVSVAQVCEMRTLHDTVAMKRTLALFRILLGKGTGGNRNLTLSSVPQLSAFQHYRF